MDSIVWTLTTLITSVILPPGLLFVLIGIGLWFGRKHRWAQWLAGVSLVAFVALSLTVVAYALVKPFEDDWPPLDVAAAKRLPADRTAIVVLGSGRVQGALEYADRETLSRASTRRAVYGAQLAEKTGLPLALAGGKPEGGMRGESLLMRDFIQKNMKRPVALVEDRSMDTRQNALYMAKVLTGRAIDTVVLVTDVTHMPRAVGAFEAAGLKVVPAPVHFRASAPLNVSDFVPSVEGLMLSRNALHEWIGAAWYALRRAVVG